jgi:hypothetical protein
VGSSERIADEQGTAVSERPVPARAVGGSGSLATSSAAALTLGLQRSIGNRHVARMVAEGRLQDRPPTARTATISATRQTLSREPDPVDQMDPYGGTLPPGGVPGPAAPPPAPPVRRTLSWMTMKRKHIHLTGDDKYGHWWTEMDGTESYGWWPKYHVGVWDTLFGCEGELNGVTTYGGTATTDPHHGDTGEEEFNPVLLNSKSDSDVRDDVRTFARSYSGTWRWTFGWGQNCHTFQRSLMDYVGLESR